MSTIFTLNGYFNYGNRLQLFALGRVLLKLGDKAMVYWPKKLRSICKEMVKYDILYNNSKEAKLRRFTGMYIPKRTGALSDSYVIVGSDQVWNPNYYLKHTYLLDPLGGEKRISYAASLGVDELTEEQKRRFKSALKHYDSISVREGSAQKLLQPLTNKKVEVVLDPTLLLDKMEYTELESMPKGLNNGEKYILCYILGGRDYLRAINEFATKHDYRIILFSDKKDSNYGVEEFLYLIHHAELICTDSFHACVFSFIFERPFVVFRRTGEADYMYSRLQNLIDTFKLKDREFNGKSITEKNIKVDYMEAKEILKKEREKSLKFLKDALGVKDEGK